MIWIVGQFALGFLEMVMFKRYVVSEISTIILSILLIKQSHRE